MTSPSAPDASNYDFKVKLERAKKASIARAKQIARNRHAHIHPNSRTRTVQVPPALTNNPWRVNDSIIAAEPERAIKAESPEHLFVDPRKSGGTPDEGLTGHNASVRAVDDLCWPASPTKRKRQASDVEEAVKSDGEKPDTAVSDGSRLTGYTYTRPYAPPKKVAKSKDSRIKYNLM